MRRWNLAWGALAWLGCFPGPLPLEVDGDGDGDFDVAADAHDEIEADAGDADDDATDATEIEAIAETGIDDGETSSDADGAEVDEVPPACGVDGECAHLTVAPCVVGRCVDEACRAVNLNVSCDDGEPCTTADTCAQGVCTGRAFTAAEAKNWAYSLGGSGADAAFDAAPYTGDEVVVVGGFQGDLELPDAATLTSSGGSLDAFLLRVDGQGRITRASRIGTADDEVATLVAVSPSLDVVLAYHRKAADGAVTGHVAWMFDNGNVRSSVELPGMIVGLDVGDDGEAYVAFEVAGPITLTLSDASQLSIDPMTDRAVVIARVERDGILWAKGIQGPGQSSAISLLATPTRVRVSVAARASTSFAGVALTDAGATGEVMWELGLDPHGGSITRKPSGPFIYDRAGYDVTARGLLAFEDDYLCGGGIEIEGAATGPCAVTFQCQPRPGAGAGGIPVPAPDGSFVAHGLVFGAYDFGGGVSVDGTQATNQVVVHYDASCAPTGLWLTPLANLEKVPMMDFAVPDIAAVFSHPAFSRRGALIVASTHGLPASLGDTFDGVVLVPEGTSDILLAGVSRATLWGCTVE